MANLHKTFGNAVWRLNHLYRIIDKRNQLIRFEPNAIQKIINQVTAPRKMILKPRQIGSTTNEVIKLLDKTIFKKNVTSCIIAHESDAIKKIFRIPKRAYRYLKEGLKPDIDRGGGSKYEMIFPTINSLMYCDLESRGDTISNLHVSEAAFMEHERFISTMQAVPVNGHVTIESTANGVGNFFYDMWHEDNDYQKLFFPWYLDAGYRLPIGRQITWTMDEKELKAQALRDYGANLCTEQILWRRAKIIELKGFFYQEYPEDAQTCFLLSGGAVIDRSLVQSLISNADPEISDNDDIKIFSNLEKGKHYVIGADPAQGTGNDYSTAVCLEIETMREVGSMRGYWTPIDFAKKLRAFARIFTKGYNFPIVAVESNNHGHAVLLQLIEHEKCPNVYFSKKGQPGWITNSVTRPIMIDQFVDAVTSETIKINTIETLRECLTLVNNRGKIEAADGKHDDMVVATAIAVQMLLKESKTVKLYEDIGSAILV